MENNMYVVYIPFKFSPSLKGDKSFVGATTAPECIPESTLTKSRHPLYQKNEQILYYILIPTVCDLVHSLEYKIG